jgi:fatty acid desaturase
MDTNPPASEPVSSLPSPAPALWNPGAATAWSLPFSPAFGAFLHAKNAKALGREDEAKKNWIWFYATLGYLGLMVIMAFLPIPDALSRVVGLGMLLGWYLSTGKKQVEYVKNTWGTDYPRKTWGKPIGIAICCIVVFLIACVIFGLILGLIVGVARSL